MLSKRIQQALDEAGISQAELARKCGVAPPSVNGWLSGKAKFLKGENLLRASAALNVSQLWLATGKGPMRTTAGKEVALESNPHYPTVRTVRIRANAGLTGYDIDQSHDDGPPIVFRADWFRANGFKPECMFAIKVCGQSMEPTLWPGDLIVINAASSDPIDGRVFVVIYEGETAVKRLERDEGVWWLASDNPDQRRYKRKRCHDQTTIVGEVVYKQSQRI